MAAKKETKKCIVTLTSTEGSCTSKLFEKMASRGDIVSTSVTELVNETITVKGSATAKIETDEKTFNMLYVDTVEYGIIHSGGTLLEESFTDYYEVGVVDKFIIKPVKCKMGTGYKAVPILEEEIEE